MNLKGFYLMDKEIFKMLIPLAASVRKEEPVCTAQTAFNF